MSETVTPKIIWLLWLQGWDQAPAIAKASRASWQRFNPNYTLHALDESSLARFIPTADLARITTRSKENEALSDEIRIELLARYGGVWSDATSICTRPLDEWLPEQMTQGFFAFDRPCADRIISTWFLAAAKGSFIIERWRQCTIAYWKGRSVRDDYFWLQKLFAELYDSDPDFRDSWDHTPKHSARHIFHFGPDSPRLIAKPTQADLDALAKPSVGVFKLTHKITDHRENDSLFDVLCRFGHGAVNEPSHLHPASDAYPHRNPRVLLGWYGSFPGHGTIGDLRSLEAAATYLVGRGFPVTHATACDLDIPGASRVDWKDIRPDQFDKVVFVCGPILLNHAETKSFFFKFRLNPLIGVGVSLFPQGNPQYVNPFSIVLARQGGDGRFGDLAIVGPPVDLIADEDSPIRIGVSLRGPQEEYGNAKCHWAETEAIFNNVSAEMFRMFDGGIVQIENHLKRSGHTPSQIDQQYAQSDIVLTSRFHGAITAMRHGVPFIAIDQIDGGGKVYELLSQLGWPYVYKINELNLETLKAAAFDLLQGHGRSLLSAARHQAVMEANRTLSFLDQVLVR